MRAFNWQPLSEELVPALHALAVARAEHRGLPTPSLERTAMVLHMLGGKPETQSRIALTTDQTVAGAAFFMLSADEAGITALTEWMVHPGHDTQTLHNDLLNWLKSSVGNAVRDAYPDVHTFTMRKAIRSDQTTLASLLEQHGFQVVRYSAEMGRSLDGLADVPVLPDDVSVVTYSAEYEEGVRAAFNEAFQEHFGIGQHGEAEWRERFTDSPLFRPELSYLLLDEESEVVAFCLTEFRGTEGQIFMEAIGTRRAWRGRGLASAIMIYAMHQYRAADYETVGLNVDTENITGALHLYEKLGFEIVKVETVYDSTLTLKDGTT